MTIIDYNPTIRGQFEDLLAAYFAELQSDIPEPIIRGKLLDLIEREWKQKIIHVLIAMESGSPVGFSICQIDTPESDWCKRPGWGFIREFYVSPVYRRQGYGRQLAARTEQALAGMGATQMYLTSDSAIPFWKDSGWRETGEPCSNGLSILEK